MTGKQNGRLSRAVRYDASGNAAWNMIAGYEIAVAMREWGRTTVSCFSHTRSTN
jgi:hypothetical protein